MLKKIFEKVDPSLIKSKVEYKEHDPNSSPNILTYDDSLSTNIELTGGKGSSLGILNAVNGVLVPYFFTITTTAFKKHIKDSTIYKLVEQLDKISIQLNSETIKEKHLLLEKDLYKLAKELRKKIKNVELEEALQKDIEKYYNQQADKLGVKDFAVAVRSSATTEDLKDASFAGLHNTYLNQRGIKAVLQSLKKCWASVQSSGAICYRNQKKISHLEAMVAVVVQKMIFPKSAGTSFSIEIGTGYPGIHICAVNGLGEALVSGEVTSDEWLVNIENFMMIKRVCGSKRIQCQVLENGSGIQKLKRETSKEFSLTEDLIIELAKNTKNIATVYKQLFGQKYVDCEFAISKTPTIYMLQCRSVAPVMQDKIMTVDVQEIKKGDCLVQGKQSLLGAVHGKIKIIENFNDLAEEKKFIEKDDIVVAVKTANYWNQQLTALKGIITLEGSPTSHPMLIGRERKLCCIVGCDNCIEKLKAYDGKWVTLDGNSKCIYNGIVKLKEMTEEMLLEQFNTIEKGKWQSDEDSINFLKAFNRMSKDAQGFQWVANPQQELCKLLEEIVLNGYKKRIDLLNKARKIKINDIFGTEQKMIDKMAMEKQKSLQEQSKCFEAMDIEDCERQNEAYSKSLSNFQELATEFEKTPCKKVFLLAIAAFEDVLSCVVVSQFFRCFLEQKAANIANEMKVSKFHFDKFCGLFQSYLIEEDNLFRDAILDFASDLLEFAKIKKLELHLLQNTDFFDSNLKNKIFKIAINFRISKVANFQLDPPIKECLKKVFEAIAAQGEEKIMNLRHQKEAMLDKEENEDYFYANPDLRRWIELIIKSRVQHCNMHHIKLRSQFKIKFILNELEKLCGMNRNEIFNCTVSQIADLIEKHEKALAASKA